jgi:hypothetical protein
MTTAVARKTGVIHGCRLSGRLNPVLELMQRSPKQRKHQYDHACGHTDNSFDLWSAIPHGVQPNPETEEKPLTPVSLTAR